IPAAMRSDGIPFGITLLAPAGQDAELASIGRIFHADTKLPVGSKKLPQLLPTPVPEALRGNEIAIAVVGAHLSGMALNHELTSLDGRLLKATTTAPDYKFYALSGTTPAKPGLLRVEPGSGSSIAVEIWALSPAAFGTFVAAIPQPLSIGTLRLADGSLVKGFLVEATATQGARDISSFGGWRAFAAKGAATQV
ncbi:MAG TPA: allophanate hydrolase, partial [Burkholderiales bacterium]|nr:allophanate hydrolase [Burkholderiales bacterium]